MERELRQQESYIHELEDYLVEYSDKLRQMRCAKQKLLRDKAAAKPSASSPRPTLVDDRLSDEDLKSKDTPGAIGASGDKRIDSRPPDEMADGGRQLPESPVAEMPTQGQARQSGRDPVQEPNRTPIEPPSEVPSLEFGEPAVPQEETLPPVSATMGSEIIIAGEAPLAVPDPVDFHLLQAEAEQAPHHATEIDRILIQHLFRQASVPSAGQDPALVSEQQSVGARPGGLLAVVEIRDIVNEPVDARGTVSLMLTTDSSAASNSGRPKRLHRWDYTEQETATAWQSSEMGDGLHLALPLGDLVLPEQALELWARLVTTDGRKLLTRLPFFRHELEDYPAGAILSATNSPSSGKLSESKVKTEVRVASLDGQSQFQPVAGPLEDRQQIEVSGDSRQDARPQPGDQQSKQSAPTFQWKAATRAVSSTRSGASATGKKPRWTAQSAAASD